MRKFPIVLTVLIISIFVVLAGCITNNGENKNAVGQGNEANNNPVNTYDSLPEKNEFIGQEVLEENGFDVEFTNSCKQLYVSRLETDENLRDVNCLDYFLGGTNNGKKITILAFDYRDTQSSTNSVDAYRVFVRGEQSEGASIKSERYKFMAREDCNVGDNCFYFTRQNIFSDKKSTYDYYLTFSKNNRSLLVSFDNSLSENDLYKILGIAKAQERWLMNNN